MILPNLKIIIDQQCIIVCFGTTFKLRGEVSANPVNDFQTWWIARALITPASERGKGYGSELLQKLISTIKQNPKLDCKFLLVTPGGYEENTKQQFNFYKKNGFVMPMNDEIPEIRNEERKYALVYRI
jgi:ribosomal protein S18 acetylase RimI-like enzyme